MAGHYGLLKEETNTQSSYWVKEDKADYLSQLNSLDRSAIKETVKNYGSLSLDNIIRETYIKFPYWAINSEAKERLLTEKQLQEIAKQRKAHKQAVLFTIGYEGRSLETYINHLIINDIQLLCDVRKNPQSQKFGFTKSQLQHACEGVGLSYLHIPELGVESADRQDLKSLADYNKLFIVYEKEVLSRNKTQLERIDELFESHHRIALTCFEKEECMCHRGRVAKALAKLPGWKRPVKHL